MENCVWSILNASNIFVAGHGRRIKFENIDEKNAAIEKLLSGVGVLQSHGLPHEIFLEKNMV